MSYPNIPFACLYLLNTSPLMIHRDIYIYIYSKTPLIWTLLGLSKIVQITRWSVKRGYREKNLFWLKSYVFNLYYWFNRFLFIKFFSICNTQKTSNYKSFMFLRQMQIWNIQKLIFVLKNSTQKKYLWTFGSIHCEKDQLLSL